jgi:hypothetical protein
VGFPWQKQMEVSEDYQEASAKCMRYNAESPNAHELEACLKVAGENWNGAKHFWSFRHFYGAWKGILALSVGIPVALYGCCRLGGAAAFWVWRGFKNARA